MKINISLRKINIKEALQKTNIYTQFKDIILEGKILWSWLLPFSYFFFFILGAPGSMLMLKSEVPGKLE